MALRPAVIRDQDRIDVDHGVITGSDPAGDIRMTVDFSNVIPPTDLNM